MGKNERKIEFESEGLWCFEKNRKMFELMILGKQLFKAVRVTLRTDDLFPLVDKNKEYCYFAQ